jgi:hypothetical protein
LILTGIWFALSAPALLLIFFINSSLVKIKFCKSLELVPNFINRYPVSHTSWLHKSGMKQGLHGQTRDQRQAELLELSTKGLPKSINRSSNQQGHHLSATKDRTREPSLTKRNYMLSTSPQEGFKHLKVLSTWPMDRENLLDVTS